MVQERQAGVRSVLAWLTQRRPSVRTWSLEVRRAAAATVNATLSATARRQRRARERLVQRAAARLAQRRGADQVTAQALVEELQRMGAARR